MLLVLDVVSIHILSDRLFFLLFYKETWLLRKFDSNLQIAIGIILF